MRIALIAAMDENRVIGVDGDLPWHYPEDLAHFKEQTLNHVVIMGRVTYEGILNSLGEPLPNRATIVLTTSGIDESHPDVYTADNQSAATFIALALTGNISDEANEQYTNRPDLDDETVYVAGGASVYDQYLPIADQLILTEVHDTYDGDAYFPSFDTSKWAEVDRDDREELSFVTYERDAESTE